MPHSLMPKLRRRPQAYLASGRSAGRRLFAGQPLFRAPPDVSVPPTHRSTLRQSRSVIATSLLKRHGRLYAGVDERSPCNLGRLKARQRGTAISDGTMEAPSMIRPLVFEEVQGVVRTAESSFYAILESYREGYSPGDLLHWNLPKCPTTQPAKKRVGSVIRGRISKELEMQPHLSEIALIARKIPPRLDDIEGSCPGRWCRSPLFRQVFCCKRINRAALSHHR